jgi:heme A synthase
MVVLVIVQVTLGSFVVLTGLQPIVNTAHLVNGALLLATSTVLALRSYSLPLTTGLFERRRTTQSLSGTAEVHP